MTIEQPAMPTRSPQADIIDSLVWSNISSFWKTAYDRTNQQVLSGVYEALFHALDAEYVRLFEISKSKGLFECPVYSQRRWLRLDLNHADELRAFLQYLAQAAQGAATSSSTGDDVLTCQTAQSPARHWHISFPWDLPALVTEQSSLLNLRFPTDLALLRIFQAGLMLVPGRDYTLLADRSTIQLVRPVPSARYEVTVGMDLTAYTAFTPTVYRVGTYLSGNVVVMPEAFSTGLPVHVLVVRNAPLATGDLHASNNETYTERREFIPYTGDITTGAQHGSLGQLVLPVGTDLTPNDTVFLFALEEGPFTDTHQHLSDLVVLTAANADPTHVASYIPGVVPSLGLSGSIDFLGQTLHLYVNGLLLAQTEYRYDHTVNTVFFKTPLTFPAMGSLILELEYEEQQEGNPATTLHTHQVCLKLNVATPVESDIFDDGGDFDDGGVFDTVHHTNLVRLDVLNIDPSTLTVYADGVRQRSGYDYQPAQGADGLRLAFSHDIDGMAIYVEYRRDSLIYQYGDGANIGATALNALLNNVMSYLTAFQSSFGSTITDAQRLLLGARIAAAGGPPFLALFFDESVEFGNINVDADNQPFTAAQARELESSDTAVHSIPFLVDHVLNPTVRYEEGVDYKFLNGVLQSSVNLLAPRGPDDDQPGVWWCPLVLLDEHMLAKNFGFLIGDVQDSSLGYRNALVTEFLLRYTGPMIQQLEQAVAAGSMLFTQSGPVTRVVSQVTGYTVTAAADNGQTQQVVVLGPTASRPPAGSRVFPGQSFAQPLLVDTVLGNLVSWGSGNLVINDDLTRVQTGDLARLSSGDDIFELTVDGVVSKQVMNAVQTTLVFRERLNFPLSSTEHLWIFRPGSAPYATFIGTITSVLPVEQWVIATAAEEFMLPAGEAPGWKVGDYVYAGYPVRPSRAAVYDAQRRPNWHRLTPADDQLFWRQQVPNAPQIPTDMVETRTVALAPSSGYVQGVFTPTYPMLSRGTLVTVIVDVTGLVLRFSVVGQNGAATLLAPIGRAAISAAVTGVATIDPATHALHDRAAAYFEVDPVRVGGNLPSSQLVGAQHVGAPMLFVQSTTGFPSAGRVNLLFTNGGCVEVEYYSMASGRLMGCVWPNDLPSLTDVNGVVSHIIPDATALVVVSAYVETIINPAFVALVQQRVVDDHGSFNGVPTVTDANADLYYDLFKGTSLVLETNLNERPAGLLPTLDDVIPPNNTAVLFARHVCVDALDIRPEDSVRQYHPKTVGVSVEGAVPAISVTLPAPTWQASLRIEITDPDSATPYAYAWSIEPLTVVATPPVLPTPALVATLVTHLVSGASYLVTCQVTDKNGLMQAASTTLIIE